MDFKKMITFCLMYYTFLEPTFLELDLYNVQNYTQTIYPNV